MTDYQTPLDERTIIPTKEYERLRARTERLKAMIQCLIDNHDHGSYESEGQAFDEARVLLAGKEG